MRDVVNISLPQEMAKEVERAVRGGNYASKSEFFRDMIRLWRKEQLLDGLRKSQKEFATGKGRVSRSLKDLR